MTQTNPHRTGPSWAAFLKKYRILDIIDEAGGHAVQSTSGNTYHVTSQTTLDEMGSMYFTTKCTCPARKRCRHVDAVLDMQHAEAIADGDHDALDILERVQ